jgi:uncharacterized OB-fold protein
MSLRVLVRAGLFQDGDPPALLAGRCTACGSHLFPRADTCPYCATSDPEPVELTGPTTLWAWTAVTAPPPGYLGETPYGVGVVEFPEGIRVIGRLTENDPTTLFLGQPMALHIVPLHRDAEGNDVLTYAFAPADGA